MRTGFGSLLLLCLGLAAPGCVGNFDPALYMRDGGVDAPAPPDAGTDAGVDAPPLDGGPDAPVATMFADFCGALAPLSIPPGVISFPIDTTALADDLPMVSCIGATPGNDTFARIVAAPNERWHFHVRNSAGSDVAIYLLTDCDERTCASERTVNSCGVSSNEHLSIVAPSAGGEYIVGIDGLASGGFSGMVEIYRPVCGNGVAPMFSPEHSENCDDGNTKSGDGCDHLCRTEISLADAAPIDVEVNDDYFAANHLFDLTAGPLLATLRAGCDVDVYAVDLVRSAPVRVSVTGRAMAGCPGGAPEVDLRVLSPAGTATLTSTSSTCPTLDFTPTADGTYFIRVARLSNTAEFAYDLRFTSP
jgi:cysteine-rich repeat protein